MQILSPFERQWAVSYRTKALRWWWCLPLIPVLGRQRQVDLYEFKDSLVYEVSSQAARATQTLFEKNKNNNNNKRQTSKQKQTNS